MVRSNLAYNAGLRWVSRNLAQSCVLGVALTATSITSHAQSHDSKIAKDEAARRAESVVLAQELLQTGDVYYQNAEYKKAVADYSQAYSLLPSGAVSSELKQAAAQRYAQAAIEQSKGLARIGQYDEARRLLEGVASIKSLKEHAGVKQMLDRLDDPIRMNPVLTAEHARDAESAGKWLRKAEGYYNLGKYDDAHLAYQEVLHLDPYNKAARRGMEKVIATQSDYYKSAYDHTRAEALAQVGAAWEMKHNTSKEEIQTTEGLVTEEERIQEVYANKLRQIVVPIVDLQDVNIDEAYDMVRVWAKEYDKNALDPNQRGVNFVLNLGDADSEWGNAIRDKRLSLNLRNVPLDQVLDFISKATGTQWRYDTHAVTVRPSGAADTAIYRRTFRVPPTFMQDAASGNAAESDDPFADEPTTSSALGARVTAKEYLTKLGVDFPEGASAKYIHGSGSLMVANTVQNLDLIEQYVKTYVQGENVQVVLKVTIVDVLKTDVEELGFDWLFANGSKDFSVGGGSQGNGDAIIPEGSTFADGYNPVTSGLRSGNTAFESGFLERSINGGSFLQGAERAPGIVRLTTEDAAVLLRGLSQKKNVDRLDTPSVIARAGEKATLFSGREMIVPTEYEPPELPNRVGVGQGGIFPVTPATPTAFEQKLTGLVLESECTVSDDRNYVDVRLDTQIIDFDGFINYGSPISTSQENGVTGEVDEVNITDNAILMPIFRPIRLNTAVTVQDGSSFVIAGLNQSDIEKVEDKVPVLGDIPLVGRFFQSNGIEKTDRALLIFVNVELKDPTGRNWRDR